MHMRFITRKQPAKAQSAYASKLLFKQEASQLIAFNTASLTLDFSILMDAVLTNALSLGVWWTWDDNTDTGGGGTES